MKISPANNILFQKRKVAEFYLSGPRGVIPCTMSQMEDIPEDRRYFSELLKKRGWNGQHYLDCIDYDINNGYADNIYVLEDNKKNCFGYMEIYDPNEDRIVLDYIETKPSNRRAKINKIKYIGETMINFLVQLAKMRSKEMVHVIYPEKNAYGFYKKCGFDEEEMIGLKFMCKDSENLRKRNNEHIGNEICFMG